MSPDNHSSTVSKSTTKIIEWEGRERVIPIGALPASGCYLLPLQPWCSRAAIPRPNTQVRKKRLECSKWMRLRCTGTDSPTPPTSQTASGSTAQRVGSASKLRGFYALWPGGALLAQLAAGLPLGYLLESHRAKAFWKPHWGFSTIRSHGRVWTGACQIGTLMLIPQGRVLCSLFFAYLFGFLKYFWRHLDSLTCVSFTKKKYDS